DELTYLSLPPFGCSGQSHLWLASCPYPVEATVANRGSSEEGWAALTDSVRALGPYRPGPWPVPHPRRPPQPEPPALGTQSGRWGKVGPVRVRFGGGPAPAAAWEIRRCVPFRGAGGPSISGQRLPSSRVANTRSSRRCRRRRGCER